MNNYLNFIDDEYLLTCISNLHKSYIKAKNKITKIKFYDNKIDTVKLTFDSCFNNISDLELIDLEVLRQIDKSINNAIGTFHEEVLGGIRGYSHGNKSGYDIKSNNNTLFADLKNKHNTMNSSASEALYQKLIRYANDYPNSKCYWVQILAKGSFDKQWVASFGGRVYNHERVRKISGDQFYALLSGESDAFFKLYKVLPLAISDYLKAEHQGAVKDNSAFVEIKEGARTSERNILDEITYENFKYYLGFESL